MKTKTKLAAAVIGSLALFNIEAAVSAPSATAEATFDWSTFAVTGYPIGSDSAPVITWNNNQHATVNASTESPADFQYDFANDWTTALAKHAGNTATFSDADADTSTLHSYSKDSDLSSASQANSSTWRQDEFSVAGSGFLVFSVNYTLDAALESGNDFDNNSANASVSLAAQKITSNPFPQTFKTEESIFSAPYTAPLLHSAGTLNLALLVNDGEAYNFFASNNTGANVSSVPLPSAVWLFMSTLIGVLGLTRRKSTLIS